MSKAKRIGAISLVAVLFIAVVVLKESRKGLTESTSQLSPTTTRTLLDTQAEERESPLSTSEVILHDSSLQQPVPQISAKGDAVRSEEPSMGIPSGGRGLPRLVDLGAHKCIPCKMMAPILEELRAGYEGEFSVEIIDVRRNPAAAREYGIRLIPTQIFYDAAGVERYRHEGFYSKEAILAKWRELGVDLSGEDKLGEG